MRHYKKIQCADGFSMSVQAGYSRYSSPRLDHAESYDEVEVGYPSHAEQLLMPYCENPSEPTETVYGYVPSHLVATVCAKHGGIVDGELPPGVPYLKP